MSKKSNDNRSGVSFVDAFIAEWKRKGLNLEEGPRLQAIPATQNGQGQGLKESLNVGVNQKVENKSHNHYQNVRQHQEIHEHVKTKSHLTQSSCSSGSCSSHGDLQDLVAGDWVFNGTDDCYAEELCAASCHPSLPSSHIANSQFPLSGIVYPSEGVLGRSLALYPAWGAYARAGTTLPPGPDKNNNDGEVGGGFSKKKQCLFDNGFVTIDQLQCSEHDMENKIKLIRLARRLSENG